MKKVLAIWLTANLLMIVALCPAPVGAQAPTAITGGGTGTFGGGGLSSHFGMGVVLLGGGAAQGHFECNMAGNAAFAGLRIMAVQGPVSGWDVNPANGHLRFSGDGTLNMDGTHMPVHFAVTVQAGGPGVGSLQLKVTSGATTIANFPAEMVVSGQIAIH